MEGEHLQTQGASPGQQKKKNKLRCALVLPGAKGRNISSPQRQHTSSNEKAKVLQKEQLFYTTHGSETRVSTAANVKARARGTHAWCNCTGMDRISNRFSPAQQPQRCHEPQLIIYTDVISWGRRRPSSPFSRKAAFLLTLLLPGQERPCTQLALPRKPAPTQAQLPSVRHAPPGCLHKKLHSSCDAQRKPRQKAAISPDAHAG